MQEYTEITKTKKRLKLSVENVSYTKFVRKRKKSYEERLYDEALGIKRKILSDKSLPSDRMNENKIKAVYNSADFKRLIDIGNEIKKMETANSLIFVMLLGISTISLFVISYCLKSFVLVLGIIPLLALYWLMFDSKVKFKHLYQNVFLKICYFCAGVTEQAENITFASSDKKQNWDKKTTNKKIVTNSFKISSESIDALVEKSVVRNYITTYKLKRGKMEIGRKLATIFSGYSIDLNFLPTEKNVLPEDEVLFAIINDKTFYHTDGLVDEEREQLSKAEPFYPELDQNWSVFVGDKLKINKHTMRELQKKIISINNSLGFFNLYVTKNSLRMYLSTKSNKDGLNDEFFCSQINNPTKIDYDGFFAIVKTLYVIYYMRCLAQLIYGKGVVYMNNREIAKSKKKKKNKSFFKNNKRGESSISTAVKILISVVIGALLLGSFYPILKDAFVPGVCNKTKEIYVQNAVSDTVDVSKFK